MLKIKNVKGFNCIFLGNILILESSDVYASYDTCRFQRQFKRFERDRKSIRERKWCGISFEDNSLVNVFIDFLALNFFNGFLVFSILSWELKFICFYSRHGKVTVHQKPLNNKSDYINDLDSEPNAMQTEIIKTYPNMDDQVNYWSDYLRMKLNPRSILLLDSQYNIDWYIFATSAFKYFSNSNKIPSTCVLQSHRTVWLASVWLECK